MMDRVRIIRANERHREDIERLIRTTHIGDGLRGPVRHFWCAKVGARIVGCSGIDIISPDTAVLTHVAVAKEFRKHGIGTALVTICLNRAFERGVRHLALVTMFYLFRHFRKYGFEVVRRAELMEPLASYPDFTSARYKKCAVMRRDV